VFVDYLVGESLILRTIDSDLIYSKALEVLIHLKLETQLKLIDSLHPDSEKL
jgi:hypothetical protein